MPASSSTTRAVAEVLNESGVVSLYPRSGRCVAVVHSTVDHIEATLPLVQPQLKVGTAAAREVLRPPLNVKDTVGSRATYRREYAEPAIDQIEVVPVWENSVVMGSPRQAVVSKRRICGHKLGITVGRQIDAGESRAVQGIREGQRDRRYRIIPVIADVGGARNDTAPYLSNRVVAHARCRRGRRSWSGRSSRRRSRSGRSRWRRRRSSPASMSWFA